MQSRAGLKSICLGDKPNLELIESGVERIPPTVSIIRAFADRGDDAQFHTGPHNLRVSSAPH